jgi:hypothetical protein
MEVIAPCFDKEVWPQRNACNNADKYRQSAVHGQMAHELFQRALLSNDYSNDALTHATRDITQNYLAALYAAGATDESAGTKHNFANCARGDNRIVASSMRDALPRVQVRAGSICPFCSGS